MFPGCLGATSGRVLTPASLLHKGRHPFPATVAIVRYAAKSHCDRYHELLMRKTRRRTFLISAAAAALAPLQVTNGSAQQRDSRNAVSVFDYLTDAEKADVRADALSINV